jgi:hypothetical protein
MGKANTLAYYDAATITAVKSFVEATPRGLLRSSRVEKWKAADNLNVIRDSKPDAR